MEGVSIRDAARQLKVSPQTVRNHIRDGTLAATLVRGQFGPEWRVQVSLDGTVLPPAVPYLAIIDRQMQIIENLQLQVDRLILCLINHQGLAELKADILDRRETSG